MASRVKQRLSTVFDWAKGAGHYPHENPVNGLKKALPSVRRRVEHREAMPWQEVPDFMADLSTREGMSARALEFILLTAVRSNEGRGARWAEFDLKKGIWTVPAERMKRSIPHRVPLTPQVLVVLEKVQGLDADLVFPSPTRGKDGKSRPMSDMVFKQLFGRMKRDGFTTHGFRSSFRDWASESAHAEREVAEAALSHAVGNEVERAYARSDLFERRRKLMDAWGRYCSGEQGNVVEMRRG
jgi:integrase